MRFFLVFFLLSVSLALHAQTDTTNPVQEEEMTPGKAKPVDEDQIFHIVQESPVFPGGEEAMLEFIQQEIRYPAEAKASGLQGLVYLSFIINKDGCIDEKIEIMRGVHSSLDEEAIRIVKSMPCWEPGRQRGVPVRTYYRFPIRFQLKDD